MASLNDIDEVILKKASSLLTYVHLNTDRHALTKSRIICLAELPELLVDLFEIVTDEPIPDDLKPFRTLQDRCETLQSIIDTLEQYLNLPLSHITGRDVAKLDRRQLSDIIQIFDDLIRNLVAPKTSCSVQTNTSPINKDNNYLRSQEPLSPSRPLSLEHLRVSPPRNDRTTSEAQPRKPAPVFTPDSAKSQLPPLEMHPSRKPTAVVITETSRNVSSIKASAAERGIPSTTSKRTFSASVRRKPSAAGSVAMEKPSAVSAFVSKSLSRKPSTTSMTHKSSKSLVRKASAVNPASTSYLSSITLQGPLRRKPSTLALKRQQPTTSSALSRDSSSVSSRVPVKHTDRASNPALPPLRRFPSGSVSSPLEKSGRRQFKFTRRPSTKSFKSGPKVVRLSKPSSSSDRFIKLGSESRKPNVTSKPSASVSSSRLKDTNSVAVTPTGRRPPVISSKVRKHSIRSPVLDNFKHGTFSPRTVSLASSVKLLQEFEYVIKRLSEIEKEMEKHLEALRCLQDEKVRLLYVMEHVKKVSNRPAVQ